MSIKKLVFLLGMTWVPTFLYSQSGLTIGYNVGFYQSAQRNLQAYCQMYNHAAGPELKEPLKMTGFYRGIVFGWKKSDETFMTGIRWSTKKALSSTGEDADGKEKIRMRMNTFNCEFGMGIEWVKVGVSVDMGGIRIHKKTGDESKWEPFYDGGGMLRSGAIAIGSTLFLDFQFSRFLEFRPYIQFAMADVQMSDDRTLRDYAHPPRNFGFSLCLMLPFND